MKQNFLLAVALVAMPGCGGPVDDKCAQCDRPGSTIDAAKTGTLKGVANFKGAPPPRARAGISAAECSSLHRTPPLEDRLIVTDGRIVNVVVSVKSGLGTLTFAVPADAVTVDNKGCMYEPHVAIARAHQKIRYLNSDPTFHNVNVVGSKKENLGMIAGDEKLRRYHSPERIQVNCDIHSWMRGWLIVSDHPYVAKTGANGAFEIGSLPEGEYEIEAWHEQLGTKSGKVKVEAGKTATLDFEFGL